MAVLAVWRRSLRLSWALLLAVTSGALYSSMGAGESLGAGLGQKGQSRCQKLRTMELAAQLPRAEAEALALALQGLLQSLEKGDGHALALSQHPQLGVKAQAAEALLAQMNQALGPPWQPSILRLWLLERAGDEALSSGVPCQEDELTLYPHLAYARHYAAWLQLQGKKEVGRIFLSLVPFQEGFKVGFLHFHRWTHGEKDALGWIQAADGHLQQKAVVAAYSYYELARKLLSGNPHLGLAMAEKLELFQEKQQLKQQAFSQLQKSLSPETLVKMDSLLVTGGAGLMLRFALPQALSGQDVRSHCQRQLELLQKHTWFAALKGLRCSYLVDGENPEREGHLGSLYLRHETL